VTVILPFFSVFIFHVKLVRRLECVFAFIAFMYLKIFSLKAYDFGWVSRCFNIPLLFILLPLLIFVWLDFSNCMYQAARICTYMYFC